MAVFSESKLATGGTCRPGKKNGYECAICVEKVSQKIECGKCAQIFCKPCCKRFVLESASPRCPGCSLPWNRQMLGDFFGKTFLKKDYKTKREKDLFEMEKALLPEAQRIMKQRFIAKTIEPIDRKIRKHSEQIIFALTECGNYFPQERVQIIADAFRAAFEEWRALESNETGKFSATKKPDIFKCSAIVRGEHCRGFVENGKCGICEKMFCVRCGCDFHSDECDEDARKTWNMLKKDSKQCPKCFVTIHKISGCDQMWCTLCHTAFSWKSGEIVSGRIHNPHYYDHLRTIGPVPREPGDTIVGVIDMMCAEGLPDVTLVANTGLLRRFHREIVHLQENGVPGELRLTEEDRLDLRIKFLKGDITQERFATIVQQREKKEEFSAEIRTIINTFIAAGTDIIRASIGAKDHSQFEGTLISLADHCNECLKSVSSTFEMRSIIIDYEN